MRYVIQMAGKIEGAGWVRLLAGFALLFAALQGSASALQSLHGEAGLIIAAATLVLAFILQRALFTATWRETLSDLGLGAPRGRGMVVAAALSIALLCVFPIYLATRTAGVTITPNTAWLALGLFAQAGVAEELVFRGFLYANLRRGRTFWRAALLSMLPFAAAHLYLFWTMDWPIALTALALSVALTFPFARLYDLGGGTIWAPVLAHAVIQGAPKLIVVDDPTFLIVWMLATAALSWLIFLVPSRNQVGAGSSPSTR